MSCEQPHRGTRVGPKGHKSQATRHGPQITSHRTQVTGHKSQVRDHKSEVTGHKSHVTAMGRPSLRRPATATRFLLILSLTLSLSLSWPLTSAAHSEAQLSGLPSRTLTSSSAQVTSSGQTGAVDGPHVRILKELKVPQGSVQSEEIKRSEGSVVGSEEMEAVPALKPQGLKGTVWVSPTVDGDTAGKGSAFNIRSSNDSSYSDIFAYNSKPKSPVLFHSDTNSNSNSNSIGHNNNDVLRKPKGYPSMSFNGKFQKFRSAFDFAWWCNNTWRCYENPDKSVQLNTFWTDKVSGFGSRELFQYGTFSVEMKLPLGNSEGMYHTFYLIQMPQTFPNDDARHAEIDIEFYGSKDYRRTWIATNIITNGYERLEQHFLPFDPTAAYHRYTIQWSPSQIIFWVDNSPIRITKRKKGGPWPARPLQLIGTSWANSKTVNWADGPISCKYRNVKYNACSMWDYKGPFPACRKQAANKKYSWNKYLTAKQWNVLHAYRKKHLINAWDWARWNKPAKQLFRRFK